MKSGNCKVLDSAFACVVSEKKKPFVQICTDQTLLETVKVKEHEVAHSNRFDRLGGKTRTSLEAGHY